MTLDPKNSATNSINTIGVQLGETSVRAALLASDGAIRARRETALEDENVVARIAHLIVGLCDDAPVSAIGIGVSGLVNHANGRVVVSSFMPMLQRVDLRAELAQACSVAADHIIVENDANAAAFGEHAVGNGRGVSSLFYVTIGASIGGALIIDDKIWRGASGFAGEFGHITIDPDGNKCVCGNIGCLETIASAPNIVRRTRERLHRDSTSSLSRLSLNKDFTVADIANEALNGDDFANLMLERTGRFIGVATAALINLLNVECILFGGDVMKAGDLILQPIIKEAARRSFQPCFEAARIVAGALGEDATAIGAAILAREKIMMNNKR
jgi:glucokinase